MIYVTPFTDEPRECTESGFQSLAEVSDAMGEPAIRYPAMLIYGNGNDRVVFSRVVFFIDGDGTTR